MLKASAVVSLLALALLGSGVHFDQSESAGLFPRAGSYLYGVYSGDCSGGSAGTVFDRNGVQGCVRGTDVAPSPLVVHPQDNLPDGFQTPARLSLRGGLSENHFVIDSYAACTGDAVTVTVTSAAGTATPTTLTEGVEWTAATSNAVTATALAAAVEAVAGVRGTALSATARVWPDATTMQVLLASVSDCLTVVTQQNGTGGVAIGPAGTPIVAHLSATASLNYDLSGAGITCQDLTITVTGAADGDAVAIGVPNALASTAGVVLSGFVSSANTVTVRACDVTSGNPNPAAATVRADVWQH